MLLSLEINDTKAKVFLEFLKNLDFVTVTNSELHENDMEDFLKDRLEEYKTHPENTMELKTVLNDLKDKYGL